MYLKNRIHDTVAKYIEYKIIAWYHREELILYRDNSDYDGDWIMLTHKDGIYKVYKGWYGSCSGCDPYLSIFEGCSRIGRDHSELEEFISRYKPFSIADIGQVISLYESGDIQSLFPLNTRTLQMDGILERYIEALMNHVKEHNEDSSR